MANFVFRCPQCRYNFMPPEDVVEASAATCPLCGGNKLKKVVARNEESTLQTGHCGNECLECG